MDIATLAGLIFGVVVILTAIMVSSGITIFINVPGLLMVCGGTFAATLIKFPFEQVRGAFKVAGQAFTKREEQLETLIEQATTLCTTVRKGGLLALEDAPVDNAFFKKGLQLCADGNPGEFIRDVLTREMEQSYERHQVGQEIWRAIGESAPAFGMIGTLVGLVQMLVNLDDPSQLGPGMALALLTTLYGALFANLVALPIADKLGIRSNQEHIANSLIVEAVVGIQQGANPRVLHEMLEAYLPSRERTEYDPRRATAPAPGEGP